MKGIGLYQPPTQVLFSYFDILRLTSCLYSLSPIPVAFIERYPVKGVHGNKPTESQSAIICLLQKVIFFNGLRDLGFEANKILTPCSEFRGNLLADYCIGTDSHWK